MDIYIYLDNLLTDQKSCRTTNALDRIDSLTALSPTLNREAFRPTIRYEPIASELSFRKQWAHVLHQIEAMAAPTKI